jgi:WD40 repeat protein/tetratricopeptide (TPR) repeat protein
VAGYELLAELGRGGMGVVYQARQVRLKRLVALKMIRAGPYAAAQDRARFKAEAEAVARLHHPHVVQIYEVGDHGGLPFFSLEYAGGGSLATKLGGTPLSAREAAQLVATLAGAMHAAHESGVVHRDLKPANVLLMADGTPKITDFGLAKQLDADSVQTQSGAVLGTPSYMAPEQAAGLGTAVGPAADTYALGAILYECLTGRPPFRAATVLDTLEQVRSQEPVAPSRLNPKVPRDLETIGLKCLHKEPKKRYATAEALADDLRRFLARLPIRARRVGIWERGFKAARRRPLVAALIGLVILVGAAGFGGVVWQWQRAEDKRNEAEGRRIQAEGAEGRATAKAKAEEEAKVAAQMATTRAEEQEKIAQQRGTRIEADLYFHTVALAEREWLAGDVERASLLLDSCPLDLRHWEWRYLKRLCRAEAFGFAQWDPALSLAFSPDARYLYALVGVRGIEIWDTKEDRPVYPFFLGHHPNKVLGMACSPDGRRLATAGSDRRVTLWDPRPDGAHFLDLAGHADEVTAVTFSPDGKRLASGSRDKTVKVWDTTDRKELMTLKGHEGGVTAVAFSPDGKRLASAGDDKSIRIYDLGTGKEVLALRWHSYSLRGVAFSPDGTRLASRDEHGSAVVWDAATAQVLLTVREAGAVSSDVAFSPDGRWLAAGVGGNGPRAVKVWDAVRGGELLALHGHAGEVRAVAFNGDGTRLASADEHGRVKVWDLTTRPEARVLRAHTGGVTCVAFSPDGRRLATCGGRQGQPGTDIGEVKVWDIAADRELFALAGHTGRVQDVAFSPDGKRLASASGGWSSSGQPTGEVIVWDAGTGNRLRTLTGPRGWVLRVAFSADGRRLAAVSWDGSVWVWEGDTGRKVLTLPGVQGIGHPFAVAFSPDGNRLAATGGDREDGVVKVWDLVAGREILSLEGHTDRVLGLAFSADGRHLAVGSGRSREVPGEMGVVKLWDLTTGREELTLRGHASAVLAGAFSPDGGRLATASADKTVKVWDARTGQEVLTLRGHGNGVTSLAFSPDGTRLASGSTDRTVRVWEGTASREVFALRPPPAASGDVTRVAFTADGRRLVGAGWPAVGAVWDAATGRQVFRLSGGSGSLLETCFTRDGSRFAFVAADKSTVKIWDAATGREAASLSGPGAEVTGPVFSPDGSRLAAAARNGAVKIWDVAAGNELFTLPAAGSFVTYSPDGQRLATTGGGTEVGAASFLGQNFGAGAVAPAGGPVGSLPLLLGALGAERSRASAREARIWDAVTGRELFRLGGEFPRVLFSPDGRWLAAADANKTLSLWDAATGTRVRTTPGAGSPTAFSPDGQRLVSGPVDPRQSVMAIWDTATGRLVLLLRSARGCNGLTFSADGGRLAWGSGGPDGNVTVCDAKTGRQLLALHGHTNWVSDVAFSPDGTRLASVSPLDWTVRLWDLAERDEPDEPAQRPTVTWHREQADDSEAEEHWFGAAFHLDRVLAAQPDSSALRFHQARACARLGQIERALEDLTWVLDRTPEDGPAWLSRSLVHARLKQGDKADADYARAAACRRAVNPTTPWWVWEQARIGEEEFHSWQAVAADLGQALEGGANDGRLWRGRGLARTALGEWEPAAADFSKAIEADAEDWQAWYGRAYAWRQLNKVDEAEADCTRAIELHDKDGSLWRLRGTIHAARPQWDKAIDAYTRAIDLGADGGAVWAERGFAHASLRHWDRAEADYLKAVEKGVEHWQVWNNLGWAQAEQGRWDRAEASFARAFATAYQPWPWRSQALLCLRRGDADGYRKTCADLLGRFGESNNPVFDHQVARTCVLAADAGVDPGRVVQLAESGGPGITGDPWSRTTLGAALCRAGRYEEAVQRLNEVLKVAGPGTTAETWLYLALAHHGLGHKEEARQWLDKAEAWLEQATREKPAGTPGTAPLSWDWRLELEALHREAKVAR